MRTAWTLALSCTLLACGPKPDGDDATGTTDASGTTAGTTADTAEPTTGAPTTGDTSGTGSASADTTAGTGDTTGPDPTGGGPFADVCAAYCEQSQTCFGEPADDSCVEECLDPLDERCQELWEKFIECSAELDCDEFEDFENNKCFSDFEKLEEMDCFSDQACTVGVGGEGDTCSMERRCPDEPVERVDCDPDGCTCFIDDEPVKMCPEGMCDANGSPSIDCCEGVNP
jgi:hypothetical protein